MSTESQRIITADEIRALELIGAAVPCFTGETIADQANRLVAAYRFLNTGVWSALSTLRMSHDCHEKAMRPRPSAAAADASAIAAIGGTRGT